LKKIIEARLEQISRAGQVDSLRAGLKGLEKESLRITPAGEIATSPHPRVLGSALTHPEITTDYSEALIELITPPFTDSRDTLRYLEELHRFVHANLNGELLLATSMPCRIKGDESIPIAVYGSSNIGRMKHIYRRGLAYRYGRAMQAIAGVHFNYSVNEALWPFLQELCGDHKPLDSFIAERYFSMIRNAQRFGWLILYLFGASPACSKSFFVGREALAAKFAAFDTDTLYRPHATSLRMSDIGYKNSNQSSLDISANDLEGYVTSLSRAISTPYPPYQRIGVKVDGEYRQLNANILQIENEFYSTIRPKQPTHSGEKPTLALKKRGIRYLELRSVDLNSYDPAGISLEQMRFLEMFMLLCLLADSPPMGPEEKAAAADNLLLTACCGRRADVSLQRDGRAIPLRTWAEELCMAMEPIARILDGNACDHPFSASLGQQRSALADPDSHLPSARILREMRREGETFVDFALRMSMEHAKYFRGRPLPGEIDWQMRRRAQESLARQREIEEHDRLSFDEFLVRYFAQT
jgi:glutamate--cysteine ligase